MRKTDDDELLARAQTGEAAAIEALIERYQAQIYRFGLKLCRDPEDAKDVLQETLLAMARGVREFRGASSISTWLYTIARSACIKQRRRSVFAPDPRTQPTLTEATPAPDPAAGPEEMLAGKQVEHALAQAIRNLEPTMREVLLLRDVEGLTAPEVAQVLGISTQAVKSRLHRARLAVRTEIAPALGHMPVAPAAMGTCPDVLTLFSQHLEDEISPSVCADMERHLQACPRCRGTCDSLKQTLALCRMTGASVPVPAAVQASVKIALRDFLAEKP